MSDRDHVAFLKNALQVANNAAAGGEHSARNLADIVRAVYNVQIELTTNPPSTPESAPESST